MKTDGEICEKERKKKREDKKKQQTKIGAVVKMGVPRRLFIPALQ